VANISTGARPSRVSLPTLIFQSYP